MLRKTLIATATAGALAVGSLLATTAGASAGGPSVQFGGPGWNVTVGGGFGPGYNHGPRFCQPIVKNVKFWTRWGKPYWKQVVVGQNCFPGPRHGGPFPGNHGPFPGNGGPFPGGPGGGFPGGGFPGGPHGGPHGPGGWGNG